MCPPGHEQATNDELGLQPLLSHSQFYHFPGPLAQKTSPVARLYGAPTFPYSGMVLSPSISPWTENARSLFPDREAL